ncbi:sensor histidine kinase [Pedobacter sp. SL55]|uniref:sensor histidine kinase n=1 Tax=Pedobacter sp. SL55 TaxID=2995161 RepID=UPI00226EC9B1|nr:sensor histidine kinase [Pedobacter sp. SL55]WAC41119.1 sensor histidine kinase [Pedobacter sp. SL55]
MMKFLKTLQRHRYFLGFIFLFAYAQSIQGRILVRQTVNVYTFTPEGAIGTFIESSVVFLIITYLLKRFQKSSALSLVSVVKIFALSLLWYLFIANAFSAIVALIFNTWHRNFTYEVILNNNIGNVLDVCIYGGFFIAYIFYQRNKEDAERLINYNNALADSKIAQLKAQLNPHFLFNNLNALDQLIEEDKSKASDFLNDFAELYRYVLEVSSKQLVPLKEELNFAKSYFRIMQHKFGNGYELAIIAPTTVDGFIAPLTLQLLIENAIEHNLGTIDKPVKIQIEIEEKLTVTNNLSPKKSKKIGGGRALENLREQYVLLSNQSLSIQQTETTFTVSLPLISG